MKKFILLHKGPPTAPDASHEGWAAWFDKIRDQLGRIFGARSTLLVGGSPLGLATGGILLGFVPSTSVIALSAIACILVGFVGLSSSTVRGLSLASADSGA
jgi:hypothetical protein